MTVNLVISNGGFADEKDLNAAAENESINIPTLLTPNRDRINHFWKIDNIGDFRKTL